MYDFGLSVQHGVNYAEAESMAERQEVKTVRDADEHFSTAKNYDGYFKYDGKTKYNAARDTLIMSDDGFSLADMETMDESVNIGKKYDRKYNGQYLCNGAIKYNGGVYIPV